MKMKKLVTIAIVLVCFAAVTTAIVLRQSTGALDIPDVGSPWAHTVTDRIHTFLSGALAIHVIGELDGDAVLHTSGGSIPLAPGPIDTILVGPEFWGKTCDLRYEPDGATRGHLSVRVGLGSGAAWARLPVGDTVPANYVGGWTTWHPRGNQMYSKGFFSRGKKKGAWSYWNEDGALIRIEEWKNGELVNTGTANKTNGE
jgi:hypothetical protein